MRDIINTVFNNISSENENSVTEVLASLFRKEKFFLVFFILQIVIQKHL